jgi:hypothetical protein
MVQDNFQDHDTPQLMYQHLVEVILKNYNHNILYDHNNI